MLQDPGAAVTLLQCQQRIEDETGKVPNTIRVSLGLASDFGDVYRFMAFAESYRDRVADWRRRPSHGLIRPPHAARTDGSTTRERLAPGLPCATVGGSAGARAAPCAHQRDRDD